MLITYSVMRVFPENGGDYLLMMKAFYKKKGGWAILDAYCGGNINISNALLSGSVYLIPHQNSI